ncbi:MAG: hypothetical protein CK551_10615 [Planctomycetaceae bacterium]|nr:MAG: hypothetical protein CK551_10615 [Planctomycetaceae bacterium]
MRKTIVKRFTQFVNENHLDNTIAIGRKAVATAYSGNSNEEMLRLTFSHIPDKEVLISLDSLANVLDPSVLDSTSDEDQEAINKALWTRAQEIAKLAGCVALIDNESDEEIDLTGRDSNSGDSDSSMDKDSRDRRNINENHMANRQVGGSHWLAEMDIDISYIVQDTPNEIMEVFMDHAQDLEDGRIQIDLDSVNIDEWTEEDVVSTDEDGNEEIDYGFSAQIFFEFKSSIQDREEIMSILEASFPRNIFIFPSIKPM